MTEARITPQVSQTPNVDRLDPSPRSGALSRMVVVAALGAIAAGCAGSAHSADNISRPSDVITTTTLDPVLKAEADICDRNNKIVDYLVQRGDLPNASGSTGNDLCDAINQRLPTTTTQK